MPFLLINVGDMCLCNAVLDTVVRGRLRLHQVCAQHIVPQTSAAASSYAAVTHPQALDESHIVQVIGLKSLACRSPAQVLHDCHLGRGKSLMHLLLLAVAACHAHCSGC